MRIVGSVHVAGLLLLSVGLLACGNSEPKYNSAQAVVADLAKHGIACSGLKLDPASTYAVEQGRCTVGGVHELVIAIHSSTAQRDKQVKVLTTANTAKTHQTILIGNDWLVNSDSRDLAQQVRAALGGKIAS